jgi:hypothetical protein
MNFKAEKLKARQLEQQQRNIQSTLLKQHPPTSLKNQRIKKEETIASAIGASYTENLNSLLQTQKIINKLFTTHPIYQEFHRHKQVGELYEELTKQHTNALDGINKLYRTADKQHRKWLKLASRIEKRDLTWWNKLVIWIQFKIF